MKKKLFYAALGLVLFAGCADNDYVGDQATLTAGNESGAISFGMRTPAITRADKTGESAATDLNNNFVVYGYKTVSSTPQTVFDNYQANYVTNTANTTESNSAGWEYVSYKNLPNGVTTNVGVTAFSALTGSGQANENAIDQSIKYWDFSASAYDFFAYSLGTGSSSTWATASALNKTGYGDGSSNPGYSLTGTQAQLGTCYISKQKHISSLSSSTTEVDLVFVSFMSKIQLKFYETIPGYSVKDVKFYTDNSTKSTGDAANDGLKPAIYGAASSIATGGTYTVTFDTNHDPVVVLTGEASSSDSKVVFDAVSTSPNTWLSDYAARDYKEAEGTVYLGRAANAATGTKQMTVLPNSTGAALTLKVDYTLLSRDGTGETIQVTGATATVPADYTKWKPNHAYTYIFKISDNTNGQTGDVTGLYPITLDAVVASEQDGSQETITTVSTPSITTYQNGAIANEYTAGNIYVVVGDGSTELTAGTNSKLYTATIQAGAAQGIDGSGNIAITEAMAENVLTKELVDGKYTVTDANGKKLTITPVSGEASDKLVGELTAIPAEDAPGGKELSIKCAKFAAVTNTVYVFEFIDTTDGNKKYYKVIKVGTPTPIAPEP